MLAQSSSRLQDDRTAVTAGMAGMRQGFIVAGHFLLQTLLQCTDCSPAAYLASLPPAPHHTTVYAVFAKTPSGFRFGFTAPDSGYLSAPAPPPQSLRGPRNPQTPSFPSGFPILVNGRPANCRSYPPPVEMSGWEVETEDSYRRSKLENYFPQTTNLVIHWFIVIAQLCSDLISLILTAHPHISADSEQFGFKCSTSSLLGAHQYIMYFPTARPTTNLTRGLPSKRSETLTTQSVGLSWVNRL